MYTDVTTRTSVSEAGNDDCTLSSEEILQFGSVTPVILHGMERMERAKAVTTYRLIPTDDRAWERGARDLLQIQVIPPAASRRRHTMEKGVLTPIRGKGCAAGILPYLLPPECARGVVSRHSPHAMVAFDLDAVGMPVADLFELTERAFRGLRRLTWTTWSSQDGYASLRCMVLVDGLVSHDHIIDAWWYLREKLVAADIPLDSVKPGEPSIDPRALDGRLFYLPAVPTPMVPGTEDWGGVIPRGGWGQDGDVVLDVSSIQAEGRAIRDREGPLHKLRWPTLPLPGQTGGGARVYLSDGTSVGGSSDHRDFTSVMVDDTGMTLLAYALTQVPRGSYAKLGDPFEPRTTPILSGASAMLHHQEDGRVRLHSFKTNLSFFHQQALVVPETDGMYELGLGQFSKPYTAETPVPEDELVDLDGLLMSWGTKGHILSRAERVEQAKQRGIQFEALLTSTLDGQVIPVASEPRTSNYPREAVGPREGTSDPMRAWGNFFSAGDPDRGQQVMAALEAGAKASKTLLKGRRAAAEEAIGSALHRGCLRATEAIEAIAGQVPSLWWLRHNLGGSPMSCQDPDVLKERGIKDTKTGKVVVVSYLCRKVECDHCGDDVLGAHLYGPLLGPVRRGDDTWDETPMADRVLYVYEVAKEDIARFGNQFRKAAKTSKPVSGGLAASGSTEAKPPETSSHGWIGFEPPSSDRPTTILSTIPPARKPRKGSYQPTLVMTLVGRAQVMAWAHVWAGATFERVDSHAGLERLDMDLPPSYKIGGRIRTSDSLISDPQEITKRASVHSWINVAKHTTKARVAEVAKAMEIQHKVRTVGGEIIGVAVELGKAIQEEIIGVVVELGTATQEEAARFEAAIEMDTWTAKKKASQVVEPKPSNKPKTANYAAFLAYVPPSRPTTSACVPSADVLEDINDILLSA